MAAFDTPRGIHTHVMETGEYMQMTRARYEPGASYTLQHTRTSNSAYCRRDGCGSWPGAETGRARYPKSQKIRISPA